MPKPTHGLELGVEIGFITFQQAGALKGCSVATIRNRVRDYGIAVHYLDQRTPLLRVSDLATFDARRTTADVA